MVVVFEVAEFVQENVITEVFRYFYKVEIEVDVVFG